MNNWFSGCSGDKIPSAHWQWRVWGVKLVHTLSGSSHVYKMAEVPPEVCVCVWLVWCCTKCLCFFSEIYNVVLVLEAFLHLFSLNVLSVLLYFPVSFRSSWIFVACFVSFLNLSRCVQSFTLLRNFIACVCILLSCLFFVHVSLSHNKGRYNYSFIKF